MVKIRSASLATSPAGPHERVLGALTPLWETDSSAGLSVEVPCEGISVTASYLRMGDGGVTSATLCLRADTGWRKTEWTVPVHSRTALVGRLNPAMALHALVCAPWFAQVALPALFEALYSAPNGE